LEYATHGRVWVVDPLAATVVGWYTHTGLPPNVVLFREASVWVPSRRWLVAYSAYASFPDQAGNGTFLNSSFCHDTWSMAFSSGAAAVCPRMMPATYILQMPPSPPDNGTVPATWLTLTDTDTGPQSPCSVAVDVGMPAYPMGLHLWWDEAVDGVFATGGYHWVPTADLFVRTYAFNLTTLRWSLLPPAGPLSPCCMPSQACYSVQGWNGAALDVTRNRSAFFGSALFAEVGFSGDCWTLQTAAPRSGSNGSAAWTLPPACGYGFGPLLRVRHGFAYVAPLDAFIMLGGEFNNPRPPCLWNVSGRRVHACSDI